MSYADYEWYLNEDLSNYAGKWVAIINKKVVAFGVNVAAVLDEVRKRYPTKRPFLTKVRNKLAIL